MFSAGTRTSSKLHSAWPCGASSYPNTGSGLWRGRGPGVLAQPAASAGAAGSAGPAGSECRRSGECWPGCIEDGGMVGDRGQQTPPRKGTTARLQQMGAHPWPVAWAKHRIGPALAMLMPMFYSRQIPDHGGLPDHGHPGCGHGHQHHGLLCVGGCRGVGLAHEDGHLAAGVAGARRPPLPAQSGGAQRMSKRRGLKLRRGGTSPPAAPGTAGLVAGSRRPPRPAAGGRAEKGTR